jgi:hypothetical protein
MSQRFISAYPEAVGEAGLLSRTGRSSYFFLPAFLSFPFVKRELQGILFLISVYPSSAGYGLAGRATIFY